MEKNEEEEEGEEEAGVVVWILGQNFLWSIFIKLHPTFHQHGADNEEVFNFWIYMNLFSNHKAATSGPSGGMRNAGQIFAFLLAHELLNAPPADC